MSASAALLGSGLDAARRQQGTKRLLSKVAALSIGYGLSFRSTPEAPTVRSTPLDVAWMTTFTPF